MPETDHPLREAIDEEKRLRVNLVPMPNGDNPWRTKGDYQKEQKQEQWRFRITILSLILSTVATGATAVTAIYTIISISPP